MNSQILKLILLSCLILQSGCDITFKRKVTKNETAPVEMSQDDIKSDKKVLPKSKGRSKDFNIIISYYADAANATIRKDMIMHTEISKKQAKKLAVGKIIPREIQVMPLPLALEKILSALPLDMIRVQVGTRVILMNVKSRLILEVINI